MFLFCLCSSCVPYVSSFSGLYILISPSIFSNVYYITSLNWHTLLIYSNWYYLLLLAFAGNSFVFLILDNISTSVWLWIQVSSGQRGQFVLHHGALRNPSAPIPHDSLQWPIVEQSFKFEGVLWLLESSSCEKLYLVGKINQYASEWQHRLFECVIF